MRDRDGAGWRAAHAVAVGRDPASISREKTGKLPAARAAQARATAMQWFTFRRSPTRTLSTDDDLRHDATLAPREVGGERRTSSPSGTLRYFARDRRASRRPRVRWPTSCRSPTSRCYPIVRVRRGASIAQAGTLPEPRARGRDRRSARARGGEASSADRRSRARPLRPRRVTKRNGRRIVAACRPFDSFAAEARPLRVTSGDSRPAWSSRTSTPCPCRRTRP